MTTNLLATAATLSDEALLDRVQVLTGRERQATVELVAHLAELDTRRILVAEGHSLFSYCTTRLGFSEDAACSRIEVARTVRRFPRVLDRLADGSLSLTTIRLVARHLTAENLEHVLAAASGRSKREVEVLAACLAPRPDVPSSVRKLPVRVAVSAPATEGATGQASLEEAPRETTTMMPPVPGLETAAPQVPDPRPVLAPLSPERYRVQFTVAKETHDTLRRLQELLRREIPSGDPALIVDRALQLLLREVERTKCAATSRAQDAGATRSGTDSPRQAPGPGSRRVPAAVRRAVWSRDESRCAFVSGSGHRCAERVFLEVHHIRPYALGGPPAVDNLALRCRRHNAYEAELAFGPRGASRGREGMGAAVHTTGPAGGL